MWLSQAGYYAAYKAGSELDSGSGLYLPVDYHVNLLW